MPEPSRFPLRALLLAAALLTVDATGGRAQPEVVELFPSGTDFYNYAPASIEDGRTHFFWWCQNSDPRRIVDCIAFRRFSFDSLRWSPRDLALAPGEPETWDSVHVCDPSVVRAPFLRDGREFAYALFYLGTDRLDCRHNQVGAAFAETPDGPWVKDPANPVVTGSESTWGTGQPSVICPDPETGVLLFHSLQEESLATSTRVRRLDPRRPESWRDAPDYPVPTAGLTAADGATPVVLHNADFAVGHDRETLWVVRPQHPFGTDDAGNRTRVSSRLQVARMPLAGLLDGSGRWEPVAVVGPEQTGYPLNHNAAFARSPEGIFPDPRRIRINFSTADTSPDSLWTYTLRWMVLDTPAPADRDRER